METSKETPFIDVRDKQYTTTHGESVNGVLESIKTRFDWGETGSLEQVYIVSNPTDFENIVENLRVKLNVDSCDVIYLDLTQANDGGVGKYLSAEGDRLKGKAIIIAAKGFTQQHLVGHSFNQNSHTMFPSLGIEKGVLVIHIDSAASNTKECVATANDSQFKSYVVEVL